jgi:hypothetical protein
MCKKIYSKTTCYKISNQFSTDQIHILWKSFYSTPDIDLPLFSPKLYPGSSPKSHHVRVMFKAISRLKPQTTPCPANWTEHWLWLALPWCSKLYLGSSPKPHHALRTEQSIGFGWPCPDIYTHLLRVKLCHDHVLTKIAMIRRD